MRTCVIGALLAALAVAVPGANSSASTPRTSVASLAFAKELETRAQPCSQKPTRRRYVSSTGSDRARGSLSHPWRTIGAALRRAAPGDVVYVRSGTYPEWATTRRDGTARNSITLRAYPGERPVVTGRLKIEDAFFCVQGLRFLGRTSANTNQTLIYVSGASHVEILRNKIMNAAMSGIFVGDDGDLSEDVSIVGNEIRGNGNRDRFDHGIYLGHLRGGLIANNLVSENRAIGVKVEPEADDVIVTQNTVVDNGKDGVVVGGEEGWSSNGNLVVNNIIAFNRAWGIRTYWEDRTGSGNRAVRNLIFRNEEGNVWLPGGGMSVVKSIFANPRFVGTDNYRLRAGSPALNRALPAFSMRVDMNGRQRHRGRADLGALER